jgi:hypothetical protein
MAHQASNEPDACDKHRPSDFVGAIGVGENESRTKRIFGQAKQKD